MVYRVTKQKQVKYQTEHPVPNRTLALSGACFGQLSVVYDVQQLQLYILRMVKSFTAKIQSKSINQYTQGQHQGKGPGQWDNYQ